MPDAKKMVSKRSARTYVEDGNDHCALDLQVKRASKYEDSGVCDETESTSSSSSTSSLSSGDSSSSGASITAAEGPPAAMDSGIGAEEALGHEGQATTGETRDRAGQESTQSPLKEHRDDMPSAIGKPANFGVVVPGVYRSSYPQAKNYGFIQGLKLKTVVTLVQKDFPEGYKTFLRDNGIQHHVFNMRGTKKEEIPIKTMRSILSLVLQQQNHPILIHCNHGKHRTGCVVAVIRKLSGWELPDVIDEYKAYAEPKVRDCDVQYISDFDLSSLSVRESNWTFHLRNFFRLTFLSLVVIIVWLWSGKNIAAWNKPTRSRR